jgi:hypothetical protein
MQVKLHNALVVSVENPIARLVEVSRAQAFHVSGAEARTTLQVALFVGFSHPESI